MAATFADLPAQQERHRRERHHHGRHLDRDRTSTEMPADRRQRRLEEETVDDEGRSVQDDQRGHRDRLGQAPTSWRLVGARY
jgi:hypothetical protein